MIHNDDFIAATSLFCIGLALMPSPRSAVGAACIYTDTESERDAGNPGSVGLTRLRRLKNQGDAMIEGRCKLQRRLKLQRPRAGYDRQDTSNIFALLATL